MEQKANLLGFTPSQRSQIADQLEQSLGPEYISTCPGEGGRPTAYIEGHKVIQLANEIFGFDGWNTQIKDYKVQYQNSQNGRHTIGISCHMRITLKDGTYHEDFGFGDSQNSKTPVAAYEKAIKAAITDATKRTLRQFGTALGGCLYDKEYVADVKRVNVKKREFDVDALRRPKDKRSKLTDVSSGQSVTSSAATDSLALSNNQTTTQSTSLAKPSTGPARPLVKPVDTPTRPSSTRAPVATGTVPTVVVAAVVEEPSFPQALSQTIDEFANAAPDLASIDADNGIDAYDDIILSDWDEEPSRASRAVLHDMDANSQRVTPEEAPESSSAPMETPARPLFVSGHHASVVLKGDQPTASHEFDPSHRSPHMKSVRQDRSEPVRRPKSHNSIN